jgi:HAD superfamily hydrolase (TIGR01509 family)
MKLDGNTAIIFDLGGVIINIDYTKTATAFKQLGLIDFDDKYTQAAQTELFDRFEIGEVSAFHFVNRLLDLLPQGCNANQVVHAWNAMIMDIPLERLDWLTELRKTRKVFLLSNTNALHIDAVNRSLQQTVPDKKLTDYFDRVYLSHEMGMRKPSEAIFLNVCDEQGLLPGETIFIDDTERHVEGAKKAGLQAVLVPSNSAIHLLFS